MLGIEDKSPEGRFLEMTLFDLSILFASVVAGATPIVIAVIGETISEKAGIINLSLDGSILLSAMTAFAVSYTSGSLLLGFLSAAISGAAVAAIVAIFSIYLHQSQVAVGFVLTLMTRDLAYFLGNSYSRLQGPQVAHLPVPFFMDLPVIGPIFFQHNLVVYFSILLIFLSWAYIQQTNAGLVLRAVGESPSATYARGFFPRRLQMLYTIAGGLLVGMAGASFSLLTKPGWGRPQGAEGAGWIVLALVIFGGWSPIRAAVGAYLFSFLQVMGIYFQQWFPSVPSQVFQTAPFPLMIFLLVAAHYAQKSDGRDPYERTRLLGRVLRTLSGSPPSSLGKP